MKKCTKNSDWKEWTSTTKEKETKNQKMQLIKRNDLNYKFNFIYHFGKLASPDWIIPTITPNNPKALPKISITRIFTNVSAVYASARAQPLPVIPTQTLRYIYNYPHKRFENPTEIPVQNIALPANHALKLKYIFNN